MPLAGGPRAIRKDMAQMAAASRANFLYADHSVTRVAGAFDVRLIVRLEEARPARA
jgi:hypothetical protein